MAKKSKKHQNDSPGGLIFPDLGTDEQDEQQSADAGADEIGALKAQIAALTGQLDQVTQTNLALSTQRAVAVPPRTPGDVDLTGLPSADEDPEGYVRGFMNKVRENEAQKAEYARWEQEQQEQVAARRNALWSQFQTQHAAYAGDPDKVAIAVQRVTAAKQQLGIDMDKYMAVAQPAFFADVVSEYDKFFGKPAGSDDDDDDADDNRTAGLPGGREAGGRFNLDNDDPEDQTEAANADMLASIREFQIKSGFHR